MAVYPSQGCVGKCLTTGSVRERALICRVCQFPWWRYSHRGWLQANSMVSLSMELERDEHNWPLRTSAMQTLAHHPLYLYDGTIRPRVSGPGVSGAVDCCGRENSTCILLTSPIYSLGKRYQEVEQESDHGNKQVPLQGFWVSYLNCIPEGLVDVHLVTWRRNNRVHILARWQRNFFSKSLHGSFHMEGGKGILNKCLFFSQMWFA